MMNPKIATHLNTCRPSDISCVIVDLTAVQYNYQQIASQIAPTKIVPVLKANAYGLGAVKVAQALNDIEVSEFFVATLTEAIELKSALPNTEVYALYGLYADIASEYYTYGITPVLNSLKQVDDWNDFAKKKSEILNCIIHIDTGMNRTGCTIDDAKNIADTLLDFQHIRISYIISHLACSEDENHPMNNAQLQMFDTIVQLFPGTPASLTATPITKMPTPFQKDMVRIGYGLFGFRSAESAALQLRPSLHFYSRVIQLRTVHAGSTVGYSATHTLNSNSILATISVGYADGYHRFLQQYKPCVYINGHAAPIVGKISMDFCVVDVTHLPNVSEGDWVQMIGDDIWVSDLIHNTDFVPHEISIHLGKRSKTAYITK